MTLLRARARTGFVALEWKPADLWIGAYIAQERFPTHRIVNVWICLLPCLPVHVRWVKECRA